MSNSQDLVSLTDAFGALAASWRRRARCRGLPTEAFYSDDATARERAKAVCARCEVAAECRAAGASEPAGIWGGEVIEGEAPPRTEVCPICAEAKSLRADTCGRASCRAELSMRAWRAEVDEDDDETAAEAV